MKIGRTLLIAVCVGAVVALVATASLRILLPWSRPVAVVDAPREQLVGLTDTELNDKMLSGALPVKSVKGMDKAVFILTRAPGTLLYTWMQFFVASALAAFLGVLLVNRRHAA